MKQYVRIICAILCCLVIAGCGPNEVKTSEQTQEPQKNPAPVVKAEKKPAQIGRDINPETLQIPVLMYHSINSNVKNNLITPPNEFEEQMKWLVDNDYHTLTLASLTEMLKTGQGVPDKPVVITFDDGYQDNYTNAYPILKKYGLKANIFVITDKIAKNNHFDEVALKEMSDYGLEMDSHTVHHFELNTLSYDEQLRELKDSKATLERLTDKKVNSICYPVGRYNEDTVRAAEASGYAMGFTTESGKANKNKGMYTLPRVRMVPGMSMESAVK